jgi:hypothetical protein
MLALLSDSHDPDVFKTHGLALLRHRQGLFFIGWPGRTVCQITARPGRRSGRFALRLARDRVADPIAAICLVAALIRFQALIAAIATTRAASAVSS